MQIVVNPDGSTTVTCNGTPVTINPPTTAAGGPVLDPNTVSALIATRRRLGKLKDVESLPSLLADAKLTRDSKHGDLEHALVLHVSGRIDVERVRRALDQAGLAHISIEIVPVRSHG
jgi:hypothetical protein